VQQGYLRPIVFLRAVFTPRTGVYQHQARNQIGGPNGFQTLLLLARAYALSRLDRKLLWAFFALGTVHVGLGISLIYDGTGRGQPCIAHSLRESLIQCALVLRMPDVPLDPFRICLYDHNKTLGLAFEVSVLVFGTPPPHIPRNPNRTHGVGRRHNRAHFHCYRGLEIRQTLRPLCDAARCH